MRNVEDFSDFESIYRCWKDFREDFDDFKHLYIYAEQTMQSLIGSEIIESDEDEEQYSMIS